MSFRNTFRWEKSHNQLKHQINLYFYNVSVNEVKLEVFFNIKCHYFI